MTTLLLLTSVASAQHGTPEEKSPQEKVIEEIIVEGVKSWEGHKGMDAFFAGDYMKAEIEFEREFLSFKRVESSRYNAAVDAGLSIDRANNLQQNSGVSGQSISTPGGSVQAQSNSSGFSNSLTSSNLRKKRAKGNNLLNDGQVTYHDFAFTKYMAALSELQLGKYEEAKKSLKTSVFHDGSNYDARMRLGLLYLVEGNISKSADQLEAMEKIRVQCKKKDCSEYSDIIASAATLADSLTDEINKLKTTK